jgi:hypothetical protein
MEHEIKGFISMNFADALVPFSVKLSIEARLFRSVRTIIVASVKTSPSCPSR